MKTICGIDCGGCAFRESCGGCAETSGSPFGELCPVAGCCLSKGQAHCAECTEGGCGPRERLIAEFNALEIPGMAPVTELTVLLGSYVNLAYPLPNGETVKLLRDNRLYFGTQLPKQDSDRCYGLVADEDYLLVCEYGEGGTHPRIILYRARA